MQLFRLYAIQFGSGLVMFLAMLSTFKGCQYGFRQSSIVELPKPYQPQILDPRIQKLIELQVTVNAKRVRLEVEIERYRNVADNMLKILSRPHQAMRADEMRSLAQALKDTSTGGVSTIDELRQTIARLQVDLPKIAEAYQTASEAFYELPEGSTDIRMRNLFFGRSVSSYGVNVQNQIDALKKLDLSLSSLQALIVAENKGLDLFIAFREVQKGVGEPMPTKRFMEITTAYKSGIELLSKTLKSFAFPELFQSEDTNAAHN